MPWLLLVAGCVTGLVSDGDDPADTDVLVVDTDGGRDTSGPTPPDWTSPAASLPQIVEVCARGDESFVEIANPTQQRLSLDDVTLQRFSGTSRNSVGSASFEGITLAPGEVFVVGPIGSDDAFRTAFKHPADATESVIAGDGFDSYELFQGGDRVDLYGALGVEGDGGTPANPNDDQPWAYHDTCSVRKADVWKASVSWNAVEWKVNVVPGPFAR